MPSPNTTGKSTRIVANQTAPICQKRMDRRQKSRRPCRSLVRCTMMMPTMDGPKLPASSGMINQPRITACPDKARGIQKIQVKKKVNGKKSQGLMSFAEGPLCSSISVSPCSLLSRVSVTRQGQINSNRCQDLSGLVPNRKRVSRSVRRTPMSYRTNVATRDAKVVATDLTKALVSHCTTQKPITTMGS